MFCTDSSPGAILIGLAYVTWPRDKALICLAIVTWPLSTGLWLNCVLAANISDRGADFSVVSCFMFGDINTDLCQIKNKWEQWGNQKPSNSSTF